MMVSLETTSVLDHVPTGLSMINPRVVISPGAP